MPTLQTVLAEATQLSVTDRLELVDALWETIPDDDLPPLSEEWLAEIARRSAEIDAGTAKTIPWETVRAEMLSWVAGAKPHVAD